MPTRRDLLGAAALGFAPASAGAWLDPRRAPLALEAFAGLDEPPEDSAKDEALWFEVQRAFAIDRSVVNLNNGGVSPAPSSVAASMARHLALSNQTPSHHLWSVQQPRVETVREGLAELFACDPEEVAVTRNASESLQTCQLGFDLQPGDHVLTTTQDYPRMLQTFRQRERREGIVLDTIRLPVPCEDDELVVRRFEEAIGDRTRLILISHVINLTGQILPVRAVVRMARARKIPVIVDGAHSFAHLDFVRDDLECDYFGTSLHKWLSAPHGTGMLCVRRERIGSLWPLMAAQEDQRDDIRKFEEIGTHPLANYLAIADALVFHRGIGSARKAARLRHLRDLWAHRLADTGRAVFATSLDPRFSCGIATVRFDGLDTAGLRTHLWNEHGILTTAIHHDEVDGLRISPHLYTTPRELDRFCEVIEDLLETGLPEQR